MVFIAEHHAKATAQLKQEIVTMLQFNPSILIEDEDDNVDNNDKPPTRTFVIAFAFSLSLDICVVRCLTLAGVGCRGSDLPYAAGHVPSAGAAVQGHRARVR
jgi:hypothetical protein